MSEVHVSAEGHIWKWVRVSTELLAELKEWSEPMQVRINSEDEFGTLDMEFRPVRDE